MNTLNRIKKVTLLAGIVSALVLSGCVVAPAPRYAVRGQVTVAPSVGFVWYDGYWSRGYHGRRWVPGYWGRPRH